jgi:O-antigen/teichoic acid export membrane protein
MARLITKLRTLKNHEGFMKYFRNTSWLFGEKILRMIVGLFVGIWVARYLGPEQFGLFSYAQSFVGLFTAIATLGLDGIVVRELVKDETRRDELIGTAFWLKLMGAFAVLAVLAIAVNFTSNDTNTNILVFIIASATIFQSFNVVDMYFQSKVMGKYITYANVISLLLSSIVKIILILNEAPLIAFVWMIVFDSIILATGYVYFYIRNRHSRLDRESSFISSITNLTFKKQTALSLLKDSWPLILSGIVISIYMKIDQIMIMEMIDAEAVGQYAAAVRISEAWYFIPMVIVSSLFPAIINAKKQSEELYYARLQKLYDLMVWMAIAIALPMTFLSVWVIHLLYGEEYSQASSVLIIHIWTGVFVALGIFGAVMNIILNFIMIPKYGIQGAAVATMLSQIISGFIIPIWFKVDQRYPIIALKSLILLGVKK